MEENGHPLRHAKEYKWAAGGERRLLGNRHHKPETEDEEERGNRVDFHLHRIIPVGVAAAKE
jgi:hypothetical protein